MCDRNLHPTASHVDLRRVSPLTTCQPRRFTENARNGAGNAKNAPRRASASGPCKYTRLSQTAPSTHASVISRHVSTHAAQSITPISFNHCALCESKRIGDHLSQPEPRSMTGAYMPSGALRPWIVFGGLGWFADCTHATHGVPSNHVHGAPLLQYAQIFMRRNSNRSCVFNLPPPSPRSSGRA